MSIQTNLSQGIKAAKRGDKTNAQDLFYAVIDEEPRNETAWIWLSYTVYSVEDRQICLENVLSINPNNEYAMRGLAKLGKGPKLQQTVALKKSSQTATKKPRSVPLLLTIAFWFGLGFLLTISGLTDLFRWGFTLLLSPVLPDYITSYQLWVLTISVAFIILGIVIINIAYALFTDHKFGYYASIIFSLGFIMLGPTAVLLSETPNYVLAGFLVVMPASVLLLTLFSQTGTPYGTKLAAYPERS